MSKHVRWVPLVVATALMTTSASRAQIQHVSGQNIQPIFNGWERNADGTFNMAFGYLNRNYEEHLYVPIGPNNSLQPGPPDQGQPTYFYPRRQNLVFKVKVPADWGKKELVWSLNVNGQVATAYGHLKLEYELPPRGQTNADDDGVAVIDEGRPNQPPTITLVGSEHVSVTPGESLAMEVAVTDDGLPKPRPRAQSENRNRPNQDAVVIGRIARAPELVRPNPEGLSVTWIHYRGPGRVTFNPRSLLVTKGKAMVEARFREPGEYVIRAYADDGMYLTTADRIVTVQQRAASSQAR